jgi:uroporphyrinogen-III synthase
VLVVLTREAGHNEQVRRWLGPDVDVVEVPLTSTRYYEPEGVAQLLGANAHRGEFRSLVVSSARARRYVRDAAAVLAPDADVFSVGPATTHALQMEGVAVRAQAQRSSLDLEASITRGPVLMLGAYEGRDELFDALVASGLEVERVACYETVPKLPDGDDARTLSRADVVVIAAPSAWSAGRGFVAASTWVVVPGPTTAQVVRAEHERTFECWGPQLRDALRDLS